MFVTCFRKMVKETEMSECTPWLFSLFAKSTAFCCYYEGSQIKVDTSQFRMMYYMCVYDYE